MIIAIGVVIFFLVFVIACCIVSGRMSRPKK